MDRKASQRPRSLIGFGALACRTEHKVPARRREWCALLTRFSPDQAESSGNHSMNKPDDIANLVRAVRARVPMDAAQMLSKETPERIGAVLAELPHTLVDRIKAYLPPELQLQASAALTEVKENTVGEMM